MTIGTNLQIFQYKILHNVLYLNGKLFKFKILFFGDSKKGTKVLKEWHILENLLRWTKFTANGAWAGGGKVNISFN